MKPPAIYKTMLKQYGPQHWWPVTGKGSMHPTYKPRKRLTEKQKFEVCAGAILTQNTAWGNVEKAVVELNKSKMLSCSAIAKAPRRQIAKLVRSSGYYNQKAERLQLFARYLQKNYSCSVGKLFAKPLAKLRAELLSLKGIGPETADSIILYAAGKPVFVVDSYTKRLAARLKMHSKFDYDSLQVFFDGSLPKDARLFGEFHALIVRFCKDCCRKNPLCGKCFLRADCAFAPRANESI